MSGKTGCAWVFGDNIDTDVLAPGHLMKLAPEELAAHCLEAVDPDFARRVKPGDIVVAGRNFGLGSSREQAAASLKLLGVKAVLAPSFARIFFRNAINLALPVFTFDNQNRIKTGDEVTLDITTGALCNITHGETYALAPLPENLLAIIKAGGLMKLVEKRLQEN